LLLLARAVSKLAKPLTPTRLRPSVERQARELCSASINESHLKRLLSEYVRYYHEDRTYLGLEKDTPNIRLRSAGRGRVTSLPRLGGLHHRYERAA
jgi:hypothetical protein